VTKAVRRTVSGALCGAALALGAIGALTRVGSARIQEPKFGPFVEPGFPYFVTTLDAGKVGAAFPQRNLAVRCVVLTLGNDSYACFDTDLLRLAAAWHGGFMSLTTMAQVSYNQPFNKTNAIPKLLGTPVVATGIYPGWSSGAPSFTDPRPAGGNPDDVGRGPIAASAGRWNGITVAGNRAVLSYTVAGTDISEEMGSIAAGSHVGVTRTFRTGPIAQPLTLREHPLVVAAVQEVAAVGLDRAARIVGGERALERVEVEVAGRVGAPGQRLGVAVEEAVGQRAAQGVQRLAQVGARLRLARVRPQQAGDAPTRLRDASMHQQVREQRDGAGGLRRRQLRRAEAELDAAEEPDVQAGRHGAHFIDVAPPRVLPVRAGCRRARWPSRPRCGP